VFTRYFSAYRHYVKNRIFVLIILLGAMSYAEGLGIALFYPLMGQQQGAAFSFLHLPTTPLGALPLIVAAFALKGLLQFIAVTYQYRLSARMAQSMRKEIVQGLGRCRYTHIFRANAGYHSNLLVNEVSRATQGFLYFTRAFPSALNVMVFFVLAFWIDWQFCLLLPLMGMAAYGVQRIVGRITRQYSQVYSAENARLSGLLIQIVQAFKYLRTTATFGRFGKQVDASADQLEHVEYRSGLFTALSFSTSQPLMVAFLAGLLYWRVDTTGTLGAGVLVLLMYFFRIMSEMFQLQTTWQSFCAFMGSTDVVHDAVASLEADREPRGTEPFTEIKTGLACDHLGFHYTEDKEVLRDISIAIPRNTSVAFVGESGSGKTTLVDILMGTLLPTAGVVRVDDHTLVELDIEQFRARIGYVPQDAVLFDDTIANNIAMWHSDKVDRERVREAAKGAHCDRFIDALADGYDSHIGERGLKLSGGQRQRLAIARELFKKPELLVLDEATSALDSESERAIQQSIEDLRGRMTMLIIAHRLSTIRSCDRIFVIHDGQIAEQGTYDELYAQTGSRFRRLCDLQSLA
jgi:subfamily B ATP-binding cassette protein MsbA